MAEPAQPADLKSQAVRGVVASAGTQGGRLVVQLASLAVLSRLLDPEDFGLVAVVMAIIGVGELIRDMGLSSAAIQRPELPRGLASNLFWMNAGMGAVAMLAAAASGPLIAAAFGDERLATVALWLAPTFLLSGLTAQHRVSLVRDLRFATLGVVELAGQALGLVAAIALAVADLGYVALIGQGYVAGAVTLLTMWAIAGWIPSLPGRGRGTRSMLRFASAMLGSSLLAYVSVNADTLIVGQQLGTTQVGLYNRGAQLVRTPMRQLVRPFGTVLLPLMSRAQSDDLVLFTLARRAQLFSSLPPAMVASLVVAVPAQLVTVALGQRWASIAPVAAVLAAAFAVAMLGSVGSTVLAARGQGFRLTQLTVVTSVLDIAGVMLGVRWGLVGVAWGILIASTLGWLASLAWMRWGTSMPVNPLLAQGCALILIGGMGAFGGRAILSAVQFPNLVEVAIGAAIVGLAFMSLLVVRTVRDDLAATLRVLRERRAPAKI